MSNVNTGWICPRCGAVHAPSVKRCDCRPAVVAPPKEGAGAGPPWTNRPDNPFKDRPMFDPQYDFLVRPYLVKYHLCSLVQRLHLVEERDGEKITFTWTTK